MYKKTLAIATIIVAILITVTPARAITFGEPDGNRHPNVGLILADFRVVGTPSPRSSGTLISPSVFLVAGHTLERLSRLGITKIWVTFDSEFDPATSKLIPVAGFATHPGFDPDTLFNDVGVLILSEPVLGVTPAVLPSENLLDQMKAAGTLRGQTFVNVGYGLTADFKGMPPAFAFDGVRRFSTSPYGGLTRNWLHLLGNHDATGEGSVCSGDSGGPHFLGDSNLIVSVTSWVDTVCRSLDMTQRLDTASVREFLDDYVRLP
ncbi:MAG: S1 family peptidase [Verrucomicrobiales bacterium]|nr:S1 family peptidase [Verrucomicrobiales bacterium]